MRSTTFDGINRYGIPEEDLKKIRERSQSCAYCPKRFQEPRGRSYRDAATIEHLNHRPPWNNPITVVYCCGECNFSRRNKSLLDWFKTPYCIEKNINENTVAEPVKEYIRHVERFIDRLHWTFAKTMPDIPHEYVVRDTLSEDDKKVFDALNDGYIKKYGAPATFGTKSYTYLTLGNYKYWMIDNILNRARNERANNDLLKQLEKENCKVRRIAGSKPLSPEGERFTFGDAEASLGQVSSVVKLSPRLALSSSWDSMYSMIISSVIAPEVAAK